jgi:hypothetical protein
MYVNLSDIDLMKKDPCKVCEQITGASCIKIEAGKTYIGEVKNITTSEIIGIG